MIIGLSGYAQTGKDTVADYLVKEHGFVRVAFADKLRNVLYDLNPMVGQEPLQAKIDVEGWDKAKQNPEVRRLLQALGVAARVNIHPDIWVRAALDSIKNDRVVITDVRFLNEAQAVKDYNGEIWRVTRPGVGAVNAHVSETQMDNYPFDRVIENNADIYYLHNQVLIAVGARL